MNDSVPDAIRQLAEARATARAASDWSEADRLRAEIEEAGWKVVDSAVGFRLAPAAAPDRVEGGTTRYGASTSVPSRLDEPATDLATVIVRATDHPDELTRALSGLRAHSPAGTRTVIVADAPSRVQAEPLTDPSALVGGATAGTEPEIVWTATRLGQAGALNAGMRRVGGAVAILLDSTVEPTGDLVTPLVRALDDPTVAVVGAWGSLTADLRRFMPASPGDVAVIDGGLLAFRREDVVARGPLDESFRTGRYLEAWWSLVLRDAGEGTEPRRAVLLADIPADRHDRPEDEAFAPGERGRLDKRAFYRMLDRFGRRLDLAVAEGAARRPIEA